MARLKRYVEWRSRGQRTERVVYVINEWNMPKPLPGAEWQLDTKFSVAEELLRDGACDQGEGIVGCRTYLSFLLPQLSRRWHLSRGVGQRECRDGPHSDHF